MPRTLDLDLPLDSLATDEELLAAVRRHCGDDAIEAVRIERRSLDARREPRWHLRLTLFRSGEDRPAPRSPQPPRLERPRRSGPPVAVIGTGPAGLFAALRLAQERIPVVVLERGKPVQARRRDIAALNKRGVVDPESNYCFGEGGAGTYSDGKLYTRADKRGPVGEVLRTLVAHGAPPEVLVDARPHVGSNRLPRVVTRLRETLENGGVAVRFESRVESFLVRCGRLSAVRLRGGEEIPVAAAVLATGHSARDVFELCVRAGVAVAPKPFAAGVRIEHPQPLIDEIQYGRFAGHPLLPPAAYRLATRVGARGVFSFCMCPGGWIVPATTSADAVVVNGMSLSRRDSPFANSGIVVALEPADLEVLGYSGPLGGIRFQEDLERLAATLGGGAQVAPAQRLGDFLAGRESGSLPRSSYRPGLRSAPLHAALPAFLSERLSEALRRFARRMRGFDSEEAVLVAIESRTSSPVRILRDPGSLESPSVAGLYPCGEGAGYAGGIASAALDGLRVAERIVARFR